MYQSLDIFRLSGAMAAHAGARQAVVARNIANADTPGFQAQSIAPFRDVYRTVDASVMRATRADHLGGTPLSRASPAGAALVEPAPNGNAVSLELEMVRGVEASREHSRALALYRHGLQVIRSTLGR